MNITLTREPEQTARGEIRARIEIAGSETDGGEYTEYNETTIHELAKSIQDRGLKRLGDERELGGLHGGRSASRVAPLPMR